MTKRKSSILFSLLAVGGLMMGGCVSKTVHCKFVNDVGTASVHYKDAATQANNPGYQAEADELKKTVDSEKQNYCQ
jgi:copper homeostasis protein CutC